MVVRVLGGIGPEKVESERKKSKQGKAKYEHTKRHSSSGSTCRVFYTYGMSTATPAAPTAAPTMLLTPCDTPWRKFLGALLDKILASSADTGGMLVGGLLLVVMVLLLLLLLLRFLLARGGTILQGVGVLWCCRFFCHSVMVVDGLLTDRRIFCRFIV